mmetsp:Transcript_9488/g.12477  ORF Transcript_9488/g.12477 Transcript_9488/m.12477 type:complete len:243 (-) Transcript_9488:993-1721(-)
MSFVLSIPTVVTEYIFHVMSLIFHASQVTSFPTVHAPRIEHLGISSRLSAVFALMVGPSAVRTVVNARGFGFWAVPTGVAKVLAVEAQHERAILEAVSSVGADVAHILFGGIGAGQGGVPDLPAPPAPGDGPAILQQVVPRLRLLFGASTSINYKQPHRAPFHVFILQLIHSLFSRTRILKKHQHYSQRSFIFGNDFLNLFHHSILHESFLHCTLSSCKWKVPNLHHSHFSIFFLLSYLLRF